MFIGRNRIFPSIIAILLGVLLTGCTLFESLPPEVVPEGYSSLTAGQAIGQTFVAENDGLDGIGFKSKIVGEVNGTILLHLRDRPGSDVDIAKASLSLQQINTDQIITFAFDPIRNSFRQYYYAFLELEGEGEILIGNSKGDTYLDGAMHIDHHPVDLQSTFKLSFSKPISMLGLGREVLYWGFVSAVGTLLFVLPGFSILQWIWSSFKYLGLPSKVGLSAGLSLSLYPLLFLFTDLVGIHLGAWYAWIPALTGVLLAILHLRRIRVWEFFRKGIISWRESESFIADITFYILLIIIAMGRYFELRTIDMPMWGDSVQHATITQLLVNNDGLFQSWAPYAEIQSLTYHFGFHTHTSVFHWITRIPVPQSMMWTGQILNILAVVSLYPLVLKMGGKPWGATVAVLVAGTISTMPNFYANWGRYTQLAGQAILPAVIFFSWEFLKKPQLKKGLLLATILCIAGLGLTHYRVLIFASLFFLSFLIIRIRHPGFRLMLLRTILFGLGAGLLFLPWFINSFQGTITSSMLGNLSTPASQSSEWIQQYNAVGDLDLYLHPILWILLGLDVIYLIIVKKRKPFTLILWWVLLLIATNPQWFQLPGQGLISNFAFLIAAYIPTSIVIGVALSHAFPVIPSRLKYIVFIFIVILGVWCITFRVEEIDPKGHTLATRPDIRASAWINENTSPQATFLTHAFFAYNDISIVGGDGGWWLPLLADRKTTLPPLNYSSEKGPIPNYREWVNSLWDLIIEKGIIDEAVQSELRDRGVTHIYLGQRGGRVNNFSPNYLQVEVLKASAGLEEIYHQDRVWIFQILE